MSKLPKITFTIDAEGFTKTECNRLSEAVQHAIRQTIKSIGYSSWREDVTVNLVVPMTESPSDS